MRSFNPQIKVTLIKAIHRDTTAAGAPASRDRYKKLDGIDLTPLLGDNSQVQTTKSVRQPCGAFSLTFADKMHPELAETVYALIEPMDIIEIRMGRNPGKKIPLVMRGFVSSVTRSEVMAGDRPVRSVIVSGHDFAKIMQIFRICYLPFTETGELSMSEFRFFQTYAADEQIRNMSGNDFVALIANKLLTPYMQSIASLTNAEALGAKQLGQWGVKSNIEGSVSAYAVAHFNEGSLYSLLQLVLDIGAFNELYVEDTEDQPVLVVRPVPFKNGRGKFIQGHAEHLPIVSDQIMSLDVSRSDDGVANYFWVSANRVAMNTGLDYRALALHGRREDFVKFDYQNCNKSIYGLRKMEVETVMGDPRVTDSPASKERNNAKEGEAFLDWVERRRNLLAKMNQDNVVFESGGMRLRGDETVKAGMYLVLHRGQQNKRIGEVYAHTVSHRFVPYGEFTTSVQFDRGTMFIERAGAFVPRYIAEIEAQGAK